MATQVHTRGRPTPGGKQLTTPLPEDGDADGNEKEAKLQKSQLKQFRLVVIVLCFIFGGGAFVNSTLPSTTGTQMSSGTAMDVTSNSIGPTEQELQRQVEELDTKVRVHKALPEMIMETDPEGLKLTEQLQQATHKLLVKRYGQHMFRVVVDLIFPEVITKKDGLPAADQLTIELAPIDLIPCSVFNFLEIARTWKSGAFHRNANHVLQVSSHSEVKKSMPFQEYSPEYPHVKGTTGYAGRPSGPGWYVSIMDNSVNHGPGSQQKKNPYEADSLFGRVVQGMEDVVPRIHSTPQTSWLDKVNQIAIPKMTILIPDSENEGEWIPWHPQDDSPVATM